MAIILYIYIYIYVIYIPWLRGVYGEYTTRAPRYEPEAKPRADIGGVRVVYSPYTLRSHGIYNIFYSLMDGYVSTSND